MVCKPNGIAELACNPSAIPASERAQHFAGAAELLHHLAEEHQELPNGLAFRFAPESLEAVARFIANERKCCPFASFEITVAPATGPLWLRITGPSGTHEVLQAALDLPAARGCP